MKPPFFAFRAVNYGVSFCLFEVMKPEIDFYRQIERKNAKKIIFSLKKKFKTVPPSKKPLYLCLVKQQQMLHQSFFYGFYFYFFGYQKSKVGIVKI
ncbi:MAG: hypothetical protein QM786_05760 [Breznakibacter sp.]